MSIIQGTAKATAGDASFYDFPIGQSLRFDGSSYLSRTFSSDVNRTTMTFSVWSKQSELGTSQQFFSAGSDQIYLSDNPANIIKVYLVSSMRIQTTQVFRDTSAWNHFVVAIDTTNTTVRLYQNGVQIATGSIPLGSGSSPIVTSLNDDITHTIGRYASSSSEFFHGYMAEINFLDGYVPTTGNNGLDSSGNLQVLGEFKNSLWIPKNPNGLSYGTNGFRLTFENGIETIGGVANQIRDESSNSNHWTKN